MSPLTSSIQRRLWTQRLARGTTVATLLGGGPPLTACAPGMLPVFIPDERRAEHAEVVEEAAALLDLGVDWRDRPYGAIKMSLHYPRSGRVCGEWLVRKGCRRALWACPDALALAHEIGHVLGLDHSESEDNLMTASPSREAALTDLQVESVSLNAARLSACRP